MGFLPFYVIALPPDDQASVEPRVRRAFSKPEIGKRSFQVTISTGRNDEGVCGQCSHLLISSNRTLNPAAKRAILQMTTTDLHRSG